MNMCEICHTERATQDRRGLAVCENCADQLDYYDNLTPEERRAEDEAMARYVEETRDWA